MGTLVLAVCSAVAAQPVRWHPRRPAYEPTSHYTVRQIEGWKVYVNNRLLVVSNDEGRRETRELGRRAVALLRVKLYDVGRIVPNRALVKLRKVPIWLEAESKDVVGACYHPSGEWLEGHGFNPEKARSIEIGNATNFLSWSLHQPSMVMHELAHAYHHQVLGHECPDIKAAYARAVASRSYESVLRYDGRRARAYALNNDREYFAELTEAYFGTNDFFPFVRAEVQDHDPEMFGTLKKLWEGEPPRAQR